MVETQDIICIHPTSLLGISDNFSRSQSIGNDQILIGGLLGRGNAVMHSFEMLITDDGIDQDLFQLKLQQLQIIYPNQQLIGFYQISESLKVDKLSIELLSMLNLPSGLIYLLINPTIDEIPIKIFSLDNHEVPLMFNIEFAMSERSSLNSIHESVLQNQIQNCSDEFKNRTEILQNNLMNLNLKIGKIVEYLNKEGNDELLMMIDKFIFEIEMIQSDEEFKKNIDSQRLELLMTVASNLMIMIKHE